MGNMRSACLGRGRKWSHLPSPLPRPLPPRPSAGNRYMLAAAAPHPSQYPTLNPPRYYPYLQQPAPGPYRPPYRNWAGRQYPSKAVTPFFKHQKAVTIRNDFNMLSESLRVEPDEDNPGKYLISFTFDAVAPGSITLMFFAKESEGGHLIATRESQIKPVMVDFQQGLRQLFRQPPGTSVDSSMLEEMGVGKDGDVEIYPLMVKGQASLQSATETDGISARCSQITQAVIEKGLHDYNARVVKQIIWVDGMRYELQDMYGATTAEGDLDGDDSGKQCVVCLSEPRDMTVLPCRHLCVCSGCAKDLRFRTNRCPICRTPVERVLEFSWNSDSNHSGESATKET